MPRCPRPHPLHFTLLALALLAGHSLARAQSPDHADVAYGPHGRNRLDLYLAASPNPTPLVIYYHGGGFVQGDKSGISTSDLQYYLQAGISVAAVNYRFLEDPAVPLQDVLRDCARALQYLRHRSGDWNINPYRVAVYGSSAGALTSLWLASHPDLADLNSTDPVLRQSTRVVAAGSATGQFSGDVEQWRAAFGNAAVEAFGGRYKSPGLYGFTQMADVYGPQGTAIRQSLDMYELISAATPPIFVSNSVPNYPILSTSQLLHDPLHAMRIYTRCQERGVTVVASIDAYAIAPPAGAPSSMRGFIAKYLNQPAPGEFMINQDSAPDAVVDRAMPPFAFTAQGGTPPYQWTLSAGQLPAGLSLDAAGIVTGTPTALGSFTFTVRATDSIGGSVTRVVTQAIVTPDQANLHFREDFETYAINAKPTATWQLATNVVDATTSLGTGLALALQDTSTTTAGGYEVNLAPDADSQLSQVHVRFNLRNLAPAQTEAGALHFSLGRFNASTSATLNAAANRSCALEFNRTGTVNLRINGAVQPAAFNTYDRSVAHQIELFVNDHETESIAYVRPDLGAAAQLGPNRVVVFINGLYFSEATLHNPGGTSGQSTLGRLGFYSSTTDTIQMVADNIFVGAIPPPPPPVPFALLELAQTEAGLELTYSLTSGYFYQLESSPTLAHDSWTARGPALPGPADGSPHTFYVELPNPTAFYRIRQFVP